MQEWREVGPGKYESEFATAEMRDDPERFLVTFTGPIEPAEALRLVRSAALDFQIECMVAIATTGCEELIKELGDHLGLDAKIGGEGEVMVLTVPPLGQSIHPTDKLFGSLDEASENG